MVEADKHSSGKEEEPGNVDYVSDDDEMFGNIGVKQEPKEPETDADYPDNMEFGEVDGIEPATEETVPQQK